ncbi:lysozyme inhibitor LprI family protein [Phenylobacterium sp.]|jgi:uncharacterized protein YecT (DUF1311 family)|uniref:lysozyme inhibitor LprI family protein n=1 Tax=Phenylobacterium sp. TaxID=1871053 RepID=UPI002F94C19C
MPKDPIGESWAGSTYNGFAGHSAQQAAAPHPHAPPSAPSHGTRNRNLLIGGVAGAVALGLVFGLWARPQFGEDDRDRGPMRPVPAEATQTPAMPVEVARPTPAPVPVADGPLEVLPPELAEAPPERLPQVVAPTPPQRLPTVTRTAPTAPRAQPPVQVAQAPPPPAVVPRSAPEAAAPVVARAPEPPPYVAPPPDRVTPSFNCRYARSPSERLVCSDPELAAADRRLARAYNRAVAAGIPARELRAEQDDWLSIREQAARRSPRAVASVYEQRIQELNELAESQY